MNNIQRGEVLLDKIGSTIGLTPCGKDWLIAALDPFHDNPLDDLSGYPDNVTTCSVIRQVKQSLSISGLDLGANDYQIVAFPWLGDVQFGNFAMNANALTLPPGPPTPLIPGVALYAVSPGSSINYTVPPDEGLTYPNAMQQGKGRLIGMGLELVNVTAPIHRSGTIYCWRLPGMQEQVEVAQYLTGAVVSRVAGYRRVTTPPQTVAAAMLLPGTRSWAAEEGAYIVCAMEEDNPPLYPTNNSPLMRNNPTLALIPGSINTDQVITGTGANNARYNRLTPFNISGITITGNTVDTRYTLNVVWFYEEFPDEQSDIVTLATPSCEYDPVALELYTKVLNTLPVAVPSSWNAAGEWWWDVVSAIREHASTVGGLIGGAPGVALGKAAGSLAGWAQDRYMTSPGSGQSGVPRIKPKGKAQKKPAGPGQGVKQRPQQKLKQAQPARKQVGSRNFDTGKIVWRNLPPEPGKK